MTETMIDLPGVIAKSDDTDFLRELVQDAAQRLMDIEVAAVCGAGHGERSPRAGEPAQWLHGLRREPALEVAQHCSDPRHSSS